jgi:hypothetical protein
MWGRKGSPKAKRGRPVGGERCTAGAVAPTSGNPDADSFRYGTEVASCQMRAHFTMFRSGQHNMPSYDRVGDLIAATGRRLVVPYCGSNHKGSAVSKLHTTVRNFPFLPR